MRTATHAGPSMPGQRVAAHRPARALLSALPTLPVSEAGGIDWDASEPTALAQLMDDADTLLRVLGNGIGSIGHLLAQCGPAIEDGSIGSDSVEALGYLLAEMGDIAVHCQLLASRCAPQVADFNPLPDGPLNAEGRAAG